MENIAPIQQSFWTRRWSAINRRLNRSDIRSVCLIILLGYSGIFVLSFIAHTSGRKLFGPQLGADFAAFYTAGRIFNTISPAQIYNFNLQDQIYREQFPDVPADEHLPYVNAPFFVIPFPILARLPYSWAYLGWFMISIGLFISGFSRLWRTLDALPKDDYGLALLISLSFMPFLVECLAGGQTSAFGFFCLSLAIYCEQKGYQVVSGIALSLCSYKPTLLLLIAPMLVITRRFRTIGGLMIGGGMLSLISFLVVGWQGCLSFIKMLFFFADHSTGSESGLKSWKYIDVNSFFRLLLGDHVYLRWGAAALAYLMILPFLFHQLWKIDRKNEDQQSLVWALTITWTLAASIYLGIYDSTLVVISVLLTTNVLFRRAGGLKFELPPFYKLILLLLFLVPWCSQPIARLTGVQLFTLTLALFGIYQFGQIKKNGKSSYEKFDQECYFTGS